MAKQLDINVGLPGEKEAESGLDRLLKKIKAIKAEERSSGEGAAGRALGLGNSGITGLGLSAVGLGAFGFIADVAAKAGEKTTEFLLKLKEGKQPASELAAEFAKSLPIIGELGQSFENVVELFTGAKAGLAALDAKADAIAKARATITKDKGEAESEQSRIQRKYREAKGVNEGERYDEEASDDLKAIRKAYGAEAEAIQSAYDSKLIREDEFNRKMQNVKDNEAQDELTIEMTRLKKHDDLDAKARKTWFEKQEEDKKKRDEIAKEADKAEAEAAKKNASELESVNSELFQRQGEMARQAYDVSQATAHTQQSRFLTGQGTRDIPAQQLAVQTKTHQTLAELLKTQAALVKRLANQKPNVYGLPGGSN